MSSKQGDKVSIPLPQVPSFAPYSPILESVVTRSQQSLSCRLHWVPFPKCGSFSRCTVSRHHLGDPGAYVDGKSQDVPSQQSHQFTLVYANCVMGATSLLVG